MHNSDGCGLLMNTRLLLLLICYCISCSIHATDRLIERHQFQNMTGEDVMTYEWSLVDKGNNQFLVVSVEDDIRYENLCDQSGQTISWSVRGPEADISAVRTGSIITIRGTFQGHLVEERHDLGDIPWYQALSYSFRHFIRSDDQSVQFWTIRPDNLDALKMTVEKDGFETIDTASGRIESTRLKIRLAGVLKNFWKAYYWFDKRQSQFIRYEGVNGPPGTPKTVIELSLEKVMPDVS